MEEIFGQVGHMNFKIEAVLGKQKDVGRVQFLNMDKTNAEKCKFYRSGGCDRGEYCPFRHIKDYKTIVCKHWLRGLCKKGDACDFLHEYNLEKMPECHFYTNFKECSNELECLFLHVDPNSRKKECLWYQRGLCKAGPSCRNRHTRKLLCENYLAGFCPNSRDECKCGHPTYGFYPDDEMAYSDAGAHKGAASLAASAQHPPPAYFDLNTLLAAQTDTNHLYQIPEMPRPVN